MVARRADRAEDIGPVAALVAWRVRAAAALAPNVSQRALLANTGFILPPEFDRLVPRRLWDGICNELAEVYGMARPFIPRRKLRRMQERS
jgi:hypothetical protein